MFYLPIIPLHIINGCEGIGTGHSTSIPPHNPLDVFAWFKDRINDVKPASVEPWWRDFRGVVELVMRGKEEDSDDELEVDELSSKPKRKRGLSVRTKGSYTLAANDIVIVDELPIGRWIQTYRKWVNGLVDEGRVKSVRDLSTHDKPYFEISGFKDPNHKSLKLIKSYGMTNMVLLDGNEMPRKYRNVEEILEAFYQERLPYYQRRKDNIIRELEAEIHRLEKKAQFILAVYEERIIVVRRNRQAIVQDMAFLDIPEDERRSLLKETRIDDCTQEEVERIRRLLEEKRAKFNEVMLTRPEAMWIRDIEVLEQEYAKQYKTGRKAVKLRLNKSRPRVNVD